MAVYGFTIAVEGNAAAQMAKINAALSEMGVKAKIESEKVSGAFSGLSKSLGGIKSMLLGGLGIGAAFEGFEAIKEGIKESEALKVSQSQLINSLKNVGRYSGEAFKELNENMEQFHVKTGFAKTEITGLQSQLELLRNMTPEKMSEMTTEAGDIAAKFKMGLAEAGSLLAKAVNNPEMARRLAMRIQIDPKIMENIKEMAKNGHDATAQMMLLDEVQRKLHGSADAAFNANPINVFKLKMHDVFEEVGTSIMKLVNKIVPALNTIVDSLKGVYNWFKQNGIAVTILKDAILPLMAAFVIYNGYLKISTALTALSVWYHGLSTAAIIVNTLATEGLSAAWVALGIAFKASGIGTIITIVAMLAIGIMVLWDKCETFRKIVGVVFESVKKYVMGMVHYFMNLGKIIGDVFTGNWSKLKEDSHNFVNDFKNDFTKGWGEAIKKGAEEGAKSTFKFSGLLGFGATQTGASGEGGNDGKNGALKQNAINTSELGGAKGGLGESKIINIKIETLQKIDKVNGISDLKNASQDAIEVLIRAINNLSYSQSGTM